MKSSRSASSDRWLRSVMRAYAQLERQWCVLSTMIQSAPRDGWQGSFEPSSGIPRLSVSRVRPSSRTTGEGIDSYFVAPGSTTYTSVGSWRGTCSPDTSLDLALLRPLQPTKTAPTKARSTSSKRVTCHSAPMRSAA